MQIRKYNQLKTVVLSLSISAAVAATSHAATLTVDTFVDEINTNGACSLREAIINSNTNSNSGSSDCTAGAPGVDMINLPAGTYTLSIAGRGEDAASTGDLDIIDVDTTGNSLVISGDTAVSGRPATIIDAAGIDRIFDIFNPANKDNLDQGANFDGVSITLQNIRIVNGLAEETLVAVDNQANGGAVFSWRFNDLNIINCEFDNNQAIWDGKYGVIDPNGTPDDGDEIEERTLSGHGGAVYSRGQIDIQSSLFRNNVAYTAYDENMDGIIEGENEKSGNGGGLFIAFTSTISNTSFESNTASNGGGINTTGGEPAIIPGNMTVSGSAFYDNWSVMGGGLNNVSPQVTLDIINSTFSGNISTDMGGGINSDAAVHLKHVTVVENKVTNSDQHGAGVNYFGPAGQFFLSNTLLSNNKGKGVEVNCGCTGGTILACSTLDVFSLGGNISSDFNCGLVYADGDLQGPDVSVLPLADNGGPTKTHALDYDSLAIDAGKDANCLSASPAITSDQRGMMRTSDGDGDGNPGCDVGAYERQLATTDLVLTGLSAGANTAHVNDEVTIAISAGNTGPDTSSSARVSLIMPDELEYVSGEVAGGLACDKSGSEVSCSLGDLGASASSNISIFVTALVEGSTSIAATVSAREVDLDTGNNIAQMTLSIDPEVIDDTDSGAAGGGSGGGFCSYNSRSELDLVLPAILAIALGYLGWRRYRSL